MAIDRPTFHESWYRVAAMKPRLRASVQSFRQHFRGRAWHVLRDLATNKFFRLDEPSYQFIALLDGRRTVGETWAQCCETFGDAAPTQGEAIQLLGQLYTSNLLDADLPGDAEGMLRRRNKRVHREIRHYVVNILFAKVPLYDPDWLLDRLLPFLGWTFTWLGFVAWVALLYGGFAAIVGRWGELWTQSSGVLAPDNLFLLYVASVVIKLVHELGHGLACKGFGQQDHSGGELHTFGVMLLVFIPMPYVDASSAWALRSRWQRAIVGAAGMYFELALAAAAAILWSRTAAGTALHSLAFNAMFTAGVSMVLFNANPLVRFDGYYILSDLFGLPNLAQRSKEKLHYLVKRYAYGVRRPFNPATRFVESLWLVLYGSASSVYRVFLSFGIVLFVADKLFFLGALMAIATAVQMFVVPACKFAHYLVASPELLKVRRRAVLATAIPLGGLVAFVGGIPVTEHGRAEGVVEPARFAAVHAEVDGFVASVMPTGSPVDGEAAGPLIVTENRELLARKEKASAQLRLLDARYRVALSSEAAEAQALLEQLAAVREELIDAEADLRKLTVRAPMAGLWLCGDADRVRGRYVKRGESLGVVADLSAYSLRMTADQFLGPRLARAVEPGDEVRLRVKDRPDLEVVGVVTTVLQSGRRDLPSEALGMAGGGNLAVAQDPERGAQKEQSAEPFFEVKIDATNGGGAELLRCGQRVVARFDLGPAPLLHQAWRWTRQLLQERFQV